MPILSFLRSIYTCSIALILRYHTWPQYLLLRSFDNRSAQKYLTIEAPFNRQSGEFLFVITGHLGIYSDIRPINP